MDQQPSVGMPAIIDTAPPGWLLHHRGPPSRAGRSGTWSWVRGEHVELRLSQKHYPVTTLGPGRRLALWFQGCTIGCAGCMSRDTWPSGGGARVSLDGVLRWCDGFAPASLTGVTLTGGEPSEQPEALAALVTALSRRRAQHGWDLLCYTGLEEEDFARRCPQVYALVDALVTGPFDVTRPTDLVWRGSANQRLIPRSALGRARYGSYVDLRSDRPGMQIDVRDGRLLLVGVPRQGDLIKLERRLAAHGLALEGVSWRQSVRDSG